MLAFLHTIIVALMVLTPANPRVTMTVRPQIMLNRGDIHVEVRVPRNPENRFLSIAWTSDHGSEGSTLKTIDGDDGPVLFTLWLRSQPAANYIFLATLIDAHNKSVGQAQGKILFPDPDGGIQ